MTFVYVFLCLDPEVVRTEPPDRPKHGRMIGLFFCLGTDLFLGGHLSCYEGRKRVHPRNLKKSLETGRVKGQNWTS